MNWLTNMTLRGKLFMAGISCFAAAFLLNEMPIGALVAIGAGCVVAAFIHTLESNTYP